MFSATLSSEIRPVCKKFMRDVRRTGQGRGRRRRPARPPHAARSSRALPCRVLTGRRADSGPHAGWSGAHRTTEAVGQCQGPQLSMQRISMT